MVTLREWLKTISFALNDNEPNHEFTRYPVEYLLAAYNAAMCIVSRFRADLFTEYEIVKLQPGRYQDARGCGCSNILEVTDQTDAQGGQVSEIKHSRKTKTTVKRNWKKPSCLNRPQGDKGYKVENIDLDPNMNGRFVVEPPVPCDVEAYVRVKCVHSPCPLTADALESSFNANCDLNAAAWHFVMARMLTGDRYSQNAASEAQYHFKTFFDVLKIEYTQEKLFESAEEA